MLGSTSGSGWDALRRRDKRRRRAGARPDLDNNDKSRPARKSSHRQLKKCFDTKNYCVCVLNSQNKKKYK